MIEVGSRLRIVRPGFKCPPSERIDIVIKRGAFGSGEHETTKSCLEELEKIPLEGRLVLDIGCGTGILAIAAVKLGASKAVCVDIAREAIETTLENARLNSVQDKIVPILGTVRSVPKEYLLNCHLVLANIYPEVLRDIADELALVREGCILIGSGVLWEDNHEILEIYKSKGFKVLENRWLEQYTTFVLEKVRS